MKHENLFTHMSRVHGIDLLETEMAEVVAAVREDELAHTGPEIANIMDRLTLECAGNPEFAQDEVFYIARTYARWVAQQVLAAASTAPSGTVISEIEIEKFLI